MSPAPRPKALKVVVPRANAHRLGPVVTAEVQNIARDQGFVVQLPPPVQEQPGSAGASAESASEWNSLLTSARAERGPQWDVATQQFLVEGESDVYYDPTLLNEAIRKANDSNNQEASGSSNGRRDHSHALQPPNINTNLHGNSMSGQRFRSPYQNNPNTPFGNNNAMSPLTSQSTPRGGTGFPGTPYNNSIPSGQFYGGDALTPSGGRSGIQDNVAMSPVAQRRITRGMAEEYPGLYGN